MELTEVVTNHRDLKYDSLMFIGTILLDHYISVKIFKKFEYVILSF